MAFSYGFFDSKNLDRVYTAENFTDYLSSLICNGIFDNFGQCFKLTASDGLNLTIGTGKAWIDGHYFLSDTPHTLDLSQYVDESLTKFVAIGISCDVSESVRACKLEVKQGTAATSPTIPTFQNTETKTYLTLCAVRLNGGTAEIVKNNITDYRGNETRCPYVRCILGKCKVSEILDALESYNATVTELNAQVTKLQNRLTEIEAFTGATGVVLVSAGQCGDAVFYALFSNGSLKLYGNGSTYDYSYTDYNAVSPFFDNHSITSLSVGDGITSIGVGIFNRCINMKTAVFPDTLRSIGERAFWQEKNGGLTTLTIPNTCTQIGEKAFAGNAMTKVDVPATVTTIGAYVFAECIHLKTATISCPTMGSYMFVSCSALNSLTISKNVRKFGSNMLTYCSSLYTIHYEGTVAQWNQIEKPGNWMCSGTNQYNGYLQKIQCNNGFLEYDTQNHVWKEVINDA